MTAYDEPLTPEPSEGSLKRARKFFSCLKGGYPIRHFAKMIFDLALEFDAIARERDTLIAEAEQVDLVKKWQKEAKAVLQLDGGVS